MKTEQAAILREGVELLRLVATRLRGAAELRPAEPTLWLLFRDVDGLADRLDESSDVELERFRHGWLGGQDFAVLDDISFGTLEKDARMETRLSPAERESIRRLRLFLSASE